ncbi:hypothetical protein ACFQRL_03805 [Microbacterium fluvii]|uniref:Uncharacterized protein n=1 Tax=Microbacterium fluvii TaxID=415215 RepID=A0ABW2HE99_9MICO|nr:hypothetical protein [Microbacterium fluvii]MCU4671719.1 hypothetical protein [Microbacterium fluvii]
MGAAPALADEETPVVEPAAFAFDGDLVVDQTIIVEQVAGEAVVDADVHWFVGDAETEFEVTGAEAENDFDLTLLPEWLGETVWATVSFGVDEDAALVEVAGAGEVGAASFTTAPTPVISGAAKVDSTLTAVTGEFVPAATSYGYAWSIGGVVVGDEATFVPSGAQKGKSVTVAVTGYRDGYLDETRTSAAVTIGAASFTSAPAPKISGTVRVGSKLTAVPGSWAPDATFTYAWKVDGKSAGTAATFTPSASQRGKKLTLTVTASRSGYTSASKTTSSATIGYGAFSAPTPKITGTATVGSTLKASAGTWSPKATLSYQWLRDGKAISKATKSSYKLTSSDWKKKITVKVTGKASGYSTKSVTSSSVTISKAFTKVKTPTISGTTRVGFTLSAKVAAWSPTASFTYQWKRSGVAISGATKSTYVLTADDYGKTITVTVTGKKSGYYTRTLTSTATAKITIAAKDGVYKVGTDIKAGTYTVTAASDCYWERGDSTWSYEDYEGILGWGYSYEGTRAIVTISKTDKVFYTEGCGAWAPYASVGTPATSFGDGTHEVGVHVQPGLYESSETAWGGCIWELASGFGGSDDEVIDSDYVEEGTTQIRIYPEDTAVISWDCGTWTRISD